MTTQREPLDRFARDRRFQVWAYTVSMGQLLLRSPKSEDLPTRVDVLFQDVRAMNLPTVINGLHVVRVDERAFHLSGIGWQGSVDAGLLLAAEDDGGYAEPSQLYQGGVGAS